MSFSSKLDSLIKDFCNSIANQYKLDETELFQIWKGESPKKTVQTVQKTLSFPSSSSKKETKDSSETSESSKESKEDFEVTREKIMTGNKDLLAAMCKKKGLKMSGKKEELVQRLLDSLGSSSVSSSSSSKNTREVPKK